MTRGKIVFADTERLLHTSLEFNGDMYMGTKYGHGDDIILHFMSSSDWKSEDFYQYIEEFDDENFGYKNYGSELVHTTHDTGCYDVSNNWTDYIYFVNASGHDMKAITGKGACVIPSECVVVFYFQDMKKIIHHKESKYVKFEEEQRIVAREALELYISMYIGRYDDIERKLRNVYGNEMVDTENEYLRKLLYQAMRSIIFGNTKIAQENLECYLAIDSEETNICGKNAYDLFISFASSDIEFTGQQLMIYREALKAYMYLLNLSMLKFMKIFSQEITVLKIAQILEDLFTRRDWDKMDKQSLIIDAMLRNTI